jgi:hypothetical protein
MRWCSFGVGGVDLAVQPGRFGGEESVVGYAQ